MKRSAVRICLAAPDTENPDTENPYTENPYTENPDTENPYAEGVCPQTERAYLARGRETRRAVGRRACSASEERGQPPPPYRRSVVIRFRLYCKKGARARDSRGNAAQAEARRAEGTPRGRSQPARSTKTTTAPNGGAPMRKGEAGLNNHQPPRAGTSFSSLCRIASSLSVAEFSTFSLFPQ